MPKSLRLSSMQASVFTIIQMEGAIGLDELATVTGLGREITKSVCLILIARGLVEKKSKEGRLVFSLR